MVQRNAELSRRRNTALHGGGLHPRRTAVGIVSVQAEPDDVTPAVVGDARARLLAKNGIETHTQVVGRFERSVTARGD